MPHQDVGKPYGHCPHKFLLDLHLTGLKHQYNACCHQNSSLWGADHCIADIFGPRILAEEHGVDLSQIT